MLSGLAKWSTDFLAGTGYGGVAGLLAFENVFFPLPSELVLPFVGFLTSQGQLTYPGAVAAATVGSAVGSLGLYAVGRRCGEERLRGFVARHGRWVFVSPAQFEQAARWFSRHGRQAVFFGRCIPGVRSLVSIPAGIQKMHLGSFLVLTLAGSGVWNAALIGLGWQLGDRWAIVGRYTGWLEAGVWIAGGLCVGAFVVRSLRRRIAAPEPQEGASPEVI